MSGHQSSVLVVDDEEINIVVLSGYLKAEGYQTTAVSSGQAALDAVAQTEFDAVLLDVMMPGIDGYGVLTQIRKAYSQIELPVIMVTALDNSEDLVKALELGANDYVRKPVDKSVMLARLQNHVALKQTAIAKAESEKQYRDLFNNANVLIQGVRADGSFEYVNPTWHKVLGYNEDDLKNLSLFDIIHPESQEHCQALFQRIMAGESLDHIDALFLSKDGRVVAIEGSANSVFDNGQLINTRSILRDVTDKRKAEGALEEKNRLLFAFQKIGWTALASLDLENVLKTLLEQVVHAGVFRSLMVALVDERAHQVKVMQGAFHAPEGQVLNIRKDMENLVYDLDDKNITAEVARTGQMAVIEGRDDRYDDRVKEPDDHYQNQVSYFLPVKQGERVLAVLATASERHEKEETLRRIEIITPLLDQVAIALNQVGLYQNTVTQAEELTAINERLQLEMTERQEAEHEMRESESRFRKLFEQSNDGILVHDLKGKILDVNERVCDMLMYDAEKMREKEIMALHPEHCLEDAKKAFAKIKDDDGVQFESQFVRSDGQILDVEISASIIDAHAGIVQGIVRDISDRKKSERLLQESQMRLRLLHSISSARTSGVSIQEMIVNTVQQIYFHFPQYRISYATVDKSNQMEIWHTEAPENMPRLEPFSANLLDGSDYINVLLARAPIVIDDISQDKRTLPLSDAFLENGALAILDVPFLHSKDIIGLLSFGASEPNAWSEHETFTLAGVAEYLSLAIADAHSQDERERAEESLQFQNALLHAQQEATIDGVLVVDKNRKWVSFNQQFIDMWHIPSEVAERKDSQMALQGVMKNLIAPDAFVDRVLYLYDHQDEKSREEIELVDGRVFDRYSTPIFGSAGQYYGRVWYYRDVTDYKKIEEALRNANDKLEQRVVQRTAELHESEERFLQLAENIQEAFYVVSMPERKSLYMSPAFETIWDIPVQTVYEDPTAYENSVFEEDRPKLKAAFVQENQGIATQVEYRIVRTNGDVRWIWDQAFPVRNEAGEVYRVVGIAEDITEQKLLSEQLFQAQKMEAVGQLAGGVAHDFNNLLTVINGYSKLGLRKLGEQDPLRDNLEEIHKAGERAQGLTSQLLAFSRKQMLQPQVLDVNMLVANLQKMLHRLIGEDIELSATMRAQSQIEADPVQLEQVMMNLVVNARDAMPTGGKLIIETHDIVLDAISALQCQVVAGAYVCLSITDTGSGIDEDIQAHMFEPFFTTKEQGKGTGLGLSTVYGIVTQSGGGLMVDSILGKGSTFKVYLPCYQGGSAVDTSDLISSEIVRGHGTVLVAEDEDMVRLLTVAVLQEAGYEVLGARSGEEACTLFEDHKEEIDLLVTDIVMPKMSGKSLADQLCAVKPSLKVLYVSGYTDDVIGNHVILEPDVPFLQKPFMPEELSEKVREIMQDNV